MSQPASPALPFSREADAALVLGLFAADPRGCGGLWLRGASPARDVLVARLIAAQPVLRLPASVDHDRLHGGLDLAASLAGGAAVMAPGLLQTAADKVWLIGLAERLDPALAGALAQARDAGGPALVLLDDGAGDDEAPPSLLTERMGLVIDCIALDPRALPDLPAVATSKAPALDAAGAGLLAAASLAFGVDSGRALVLAAHVARLHAQATGSDAPALGEADLAAAIRLVLLPRATRSPTADTSPDSAPPPEPPPAEPTPPDAEQDATTPPQPGQLPEDRLVAAALALLPADLLAQLTAGRAGARARGGGAGRKVSGGLRGRRLAPRPGLPRGGKRLALVETLRCAAPWQAWRRKEAGRGEGAGDHTLIITREDLRVRRFEDRSPPVTLFAVDASGSAAFARLAEAKGAVERLLAQAYVQRAEVALVAFRGTGATVLLPPTRSLTRARRALAELPGGGGTPLAAGLDVLRDLAEAQTRRGRTPLLVVLTDGRANVAAHGEGRAAALAEADAAARRIVALGLDSLVIDISPRPRPEAARLAEHLRGRYLPLPFGNAEGLANVIKAAA